MVVSRKSLPTTAEACPCLQPFCLLERKNKVGATFSAMMRALLPLVLPWVCLAEPCLPGEATCEGDVGDVATFLHHKHRRSTRSSGPAVPCSSSLSSATWQLRKRFDEVFVELYGAPVNKNGMSDTKMRDHWPDMTVQGSQRRTKALSELMAELDDAFADAGQPLYDRPTSLLPFPNHSPPWV